jgi:hypothetical protein
MFLKTIIYVFGTTTAFSRNAVALLGQAGSDPGIGAPRVEAFLRIG